VIDGELHGDHHRRPQGGNGDVVAAPGPEGHQKRQAHDRGLHHGLQPTQ
jgi:hypothetical protein